MVVQSPRERGLKFKPFDLGASAQWLQRQGRRPPSRVILNPRELALADRIKRLKKDAGSHSPSAWTLAKLIPELRLKVDACFLSNPYATNLFLMHFHREVIRPKKLRALLELYPSQNRGDCGSWAGSSSWSPIRSSSATAPPRSSRRSSIDSPVQKILVNLPTFSPYYEFARPDTQVVYNLLRKEDDFRFDPGEYLEVVRREQPDTVVLINPNNPDGGYIPHAVLVELLEELALVPNVIVDESFIHFACEGDGYAYQSVSDEVSRFPNLMVVKSMSKDFGVAGIRAGYAVMAPDRVRTLLNNGYLWNSSGLAEYFFDLYSRPDFQERYERERIRFIRNSRRFFSALAKIKDSTSTRPSPTSRWSSSATASVPRSSSAACSSAAGSTPGPATTRGTRDRQVRPDRRP